MKARNYKEYFLHPVEAPQRQYEAIRAVVVEEQSMKEVAQRFDVSYGTLRNWVSEFCQVQHAGQSPPFLPSPRADVPRLTNLVTKTTRKSNPPMFGRCRWKRDVG